MQCVVSAKYASASASCGRPGFAGAAGKIVLALALACGAAFASPGDRGTADAAPTDAEFTRYFFPERNGLVPDLDLQARFSASGSGVVYRKGTQGNGQVLFADPKTGGIAVLVQEAALRAALTGAGAPAGMPRIERYLPAKKQLQVAMGDSGQWIYELATGKVSKRDTTPAQELPSPDGKHSLFVREYNLWIRNDHGDEVALTRDGNFDRRYAINYPRFGQQVEANSQTPPMPVEANWSPDSRHVLTYRLDRNGSAIHEGVQREPPGGAGPRRFGYVYPNAGDARVPLVHPVLIDVATRKVRLLDVPVQQMVFPVPPKLSWVEGRISYQWSSRGFGELTLFEVDPDSGKAQVRLHEALQPNVTVTSTFIRPAPEWKGTLLVSERSGWGQLYFVADGSDPRKGRRLTTGNWEINGLLWADKEGVLVTGKGREPGLNPYYEQLYRVGLDGALTRLTPEALHHDVEISTDGKWFIDRMSSPLEPTRTVLRDASDGRIVVELGRADPSKLEADGHVPPEIFQGISLDGGATLYATIYRPRNFDPSKRYPVIEHVYTGPTRHRFSGDYGQNIGGMPAALTQLGAIVVTIDAPGTAGRGRAFRMQAYQNLHRVGIDDHVAMLKAMQARYPYMDIDRGVGVIGGSSGGYDTFRFLVNRPDIYRAGVSQSGNHQLRMVKAWWPEIHMGFADESVWIDNSNAAHAARLQGRLLLVHGDIDDNVPIGTTLTLSQALTDAGKPHELLILPNVGHAVRTPEFHAAVREFFMREIVRADGK